MKRSLFHIGALMLIATGIVLTACMDDHDAPDVSNYSITKETSVGDTTISIHNLKDKYASVFTQNNSFTMIEDDEIVEGVVVANDKGGNLYQTLMLAEYKSEYDFVDPSDAIVLAVKNTCLYPYFPYGQMVRVNLKGLYVGCYSKLPKIGQPYYTSSNNLRLGPMLFEICKTNIYLVGKPSDYINKITPFELPDDSHEMFHNKSYQNYKNAPMLVRVTGKFVGGDDETILAPDELKDAGMGVDRDFKIGSTTITVRTSTQNDVSFLKMPKSTVRLTGMLSYYDGWQLQLRSVDDMEIINE
jgi:hypothetical protein